MSSVNAGSSAPLRGRSYKPQKGEKGTRRGWSPQEEEFLIVALKELVASSWKADNGFRQGYQQRLEAMIKDEFPGTDIRMSPHIGSKLQIWKKQHQALCMILGRSGVGFNSNGKHMIECEDDQWEQILKIDPGVKSYRYKSWPLLDDWNLIFGKDRATGDAAEDVEDAANDTNEGCEGEQKAEEQQSEHTHDFTADNEGENSACHNSSKDVVNKPSTRGKKWKQQDNVSIVASVISEISRSTSARLDTIAQRIGYEFDVDESRMDAYNSLKNVSGLSQKQRFAVAEIFVDKTERYLLFKGLPNEDAKSEYVQHLLGNL